MRIIFAPHYRSNGLKNTKKWPDMQVVTAKLNQIVKGYEKILFPAIGWSV